MGTRLNKSKKKKMKKHKEWVGNIQTKTIQNQAYRRVLSTGRKLQLVVMKLKPKEMVGFEIHPHTDQFIRIEAGRATVTLGQGRKMRIYSLHGDDAIVIPAGTWHNVVNASSKDRLALYTIYAPPEHPDGLVELYK